MKKFVLCTLLAGLMMSVAAQEKLPFNNIESKSIHVSEMKYDLGLSDVGMLPVNPMESILDVTIDGWAIVGTSNSYDRQTQGSVYPMTKIHDDGLFIGCTWTNEDNTSFPGSSTPLRGIGYSYSTDGGLTWSAQEKRVGGIPLYWPSYAQWGANGEAILGRSADTYNHGGVQILNGLVLLTRENRGVGDWTITPVPYPTGTSPSSSYIMAWARMTTSGNNHQYIHIMSPMQLPTSQVYNGYYDPVFYYRTQNGGSTWDIAGELVPEMVGEEWDAHSSYTDAITFADTEGDVVACSFIRIGDDGYVLRSYDNGNTWGSIKFFDSPVCRYITPSQYADTCFIPTQGCIALDNNGKIHVAFSVLMAINNESEGSIGYFSGLMTSFLSYWNEYMGPIDGAAEFVKHKIYPILEDYFDWNLSYDDKFYVKSTVPKWPIIGYFTPTLDNHIFTIDNEIIRAWATASYGLAGCFSFPQMAIDRENTLHLAYLGLLDGGGNYSYHCFRHPYYTVTKGGVIWGQTQYLVNNINVIDMEFAYLTSAGVDEKPQQKIHLMAQVDPYPGTYTAYVNSSSDHGPTTNYFYHFQVEGDDIEPCYPVGNFAVHYSADCSKAELTWDAPDRGDFTYKVYRDGNLIATVIGENSYTDVGFNVAVGHTWKVTVICMGNVESLPASVTKPVCVPCYPVTNLTVDYSADCSKAELAWDDPEKGNLTCKVYRDDNLIATVTGQNSYTDEEFDTTVGHTWKVTVVCGDEESSPISVTKGVCTPCNPVTDASATIEDCSVATITWTAVEGAVEYRISMDDNIEIVSGGTTSIVITSVDGFEHGKTYTWEIVTVCAENESDPVEVTATADCTGINELSNSVAIYPNPVSGMITINATGFAKVEVYNTIGQLIETRTINTFDVSSYNSGVYFFKVYDTDNNNVTKRVMVTK